MASNSNWLNPVVDYLNAAKSGSDVGMALARILNDKSEASAKLAQAAQAEADQTDLGYAQIGAKERESGQSAAEKLQAATEQQSALNNWRNEKLDQGQQGLDLRAANTGSMIDTRTGKLAQGDRRLDQGDTRIDQGQQRIDDRAAQNTIANSLKSQAFELSKSKTITPGDRAVLQGATHSLWSAQKALTDPLMLSTSPSYTNAVNQINDAKKVIESFRKPTASAADSLTTPTTSTGTGPSAADALTGSSQWFQPQGAGQDTTGSAVPAAQSLIDSGNQTNASALPASASTVTTQEQFDALKSGDTYVGEDGKTYRKP